MADKDLIRFYLDTMVLNEHLTQWYRAVFVAFYVGVIIIAALFVTTERELAKLTFPVVVCGLILSVLWVWITSQRTNIVERQKEKIKELTKGDKNLADCFKIYTFKRTKCAPELTFNIFLPLFIGFALIYTLWEFALPYLPESTNLYKFLLKLPLEYEDACSIFCAFLAFVFIILSILAKLKWSRIPEG